MNAENWTELTSAYGATFTPKLSPERNLLPAVVDLYDRVVATPGAAIGNLTEVALDAFVETSDPPTQVQVAAIASAVTNLATQYDNTIGVLNVILARLRAKNIIAE